MTTPAIRSSYKLITPPAAEPIDLAFAKLHLRFQPGTEDSLITLWIAAARQYVESQTDRQLVEATYEYRLDAWPTGPLELPKPPLIAVLAVNDVPIVPAAWAIDAPSGPHAARGILMPAGGAWPTVEAGLNAVRVQFTAGYGDPDAVPELLRAAVLQLVAHFHQFRGAMYQATDGALVGLDPSVAMILRTFEISAKPIHPARVVAPWGYP